MSDDMRQHALFDPGSHRLAPLVVVVGEVELRFFPVTVYLVNLAAVLTHGKCKVNAW